MKTRTIGTVAAVLLASATAAAPLPALAGNDLVRELLRQQSAAERAGCDGVRRVLAGGRDPGLVVRTAVELGHNACQVIRCALENACASGRIAADLAPVIQGAAAGGVSPDVISRCAVQTCADPAAVAAVLAEVLLDPNYCYFAPEPERGAPPLPPVLPVVDRSLPAPQASPYAF